MGVPKVGKSLNIEGVTAYQDSDDASTWWYIPNQVPVALGESLLTFQIKYWGISAPHFIDGPFPEEITGAIVSGQSVVDLNTSQKNALITELKENYGIAQPKIKPVDIKNVADVQLTLATNTLKVSDKILPSRIQIGTSFSWTVGANNSLFAEFVAGANFNYGDPITPNPSFVEMQGDPWIVIVKANLDQTWRYIRNKLDAKVAWGTANLGVSVDTLIEDLQVNGAVTIQFIEGSLDNKKYGDQLFEIGSKIFEQLNTQLLAKDGLFKLEPNPTPPEIREPGAPSWLPTFNLAYNAQSQSINYEARLEYTGRVVKQLPLNVILAVNPSREVAKFFTDMDDAKEPFITPAKVKSFQDRMSQKARDCRDSAKEYEQALLSGKINLETYSALMNRLQGRTTNIALGGDLATKVANFVASRNIIATSSALADLNKLDKTSLSTLYHQIDSVADRDGNKLLFAHPVDDKRVLITKFVRGASRSDWILKGIELASRKSVLNGEERDLLLSAFKGLNHGVQVIIPGSNFVPISLSASAHFPYSVYGKLEMTFPSGEEYVGTAWQYSPTVLVTCAHNLYDANDGGKATSIEYFPHYVTGSTAKVKASKWFYPPEYESHSFSKLGVPRNSRFTLGPDDVLYDYGIVILREAVPAPKVFNMPSPDTTTVGKLKAVGYREATGYTMEESEGNLISSGPKYIYHGCSTESGWSGTAVTGLDSNSVRYALGIHCGGGNIANSNIARRIDNDVIADIERWSRNSLLNQESYGNF